MPANTGYQSASPKPVQRRVPGAVQTSMPITPEEAAALLRFNDGDFGTGFDELQPAGASDIIYSAVPGGTVAPAVGAALPGATAVAPIEVKPVGAPSKTGPAVEVPLGEGTPLPRSGDVAVPGTGQAEALAEEDLFMQSVPGVAAVPTPSGAPFVLTPEEEGLAATFMDDAGSGFDFFQTGPVGGDAPALSEEPNVTMETVPVGAPAEEKELPYMPLDEVFSQAASNFGSSAWQAGSDLLAPILDPIGTAKAAWGLINGVYQKFQDGEHADEKYADAFGQFLKDRYGSWEAAKRTFAKDPVGFASDVSIILTGGGAAAVKVPAAFAKAGRIANRGGRALEAANVPASIGNAGGTVAKTGEAIEAAKLPGMIGDAGRAVNAVGRSIEPFRLAGQGIATLVGEVGTRTGGKSLRLAGQAGRKGGAEADVFRTNLRGHASAEDLVKEARSTVSKERGRLEEAYRRLETAHLRDELDGPRTPLDFKAIEKSVSEIPVKKFRGHVLDDDVAEVQRKLAKEVNAWKALDPNEYHTAVGLDAFRQRIGKIRDGLPEGSKERIAADKIYDAALQQIETQAPDFARSIRQLDKETKRVRKIERVLKLEPDVLTDDSLAKLEGLLSDIPSARNQRLAETAKPLVESEYFMPKLAGQALSGPLPWEGGPVSGLAATGALPALGNTGVIAGATSAARFSPRLAGEAAYYAGKVYPWSLFPYELGQIKEAMEDENR